MKKNNKTKFTLVLVAVAAILVAIFGPAMVEDVPNGEIVVNQVPVSGDIEVWSDPGLKIDDE
jgi:hypothetical protein